MTEKIRNCPMCGYFAVMKIDVNEEHAWHHYHLRCSCCGVRTPSYCTENAAREAWNIRIKKENEDEQV